MKKVFIFVLICITVFCVFYYIFQKKGNNKISKNEKRIEDVLNSFYNYEAEVETVVYSNKTERKYNMKQEVKENISRCIIEDPKMIIEKSKNIIKITNSVLNVEKVYENLSDITNNYFFLNTFSNDCMENGFEMEERDGKIFIKTKLINNYNTYVKEKELEINRENLKPEKLVIKDNTQNLRVCIKYNNVVI